jgi:hypothetical protein
MQPVHDAFNATIATGSHDGANLIDPCSLGRTTPNQAHASTQRDEIPTARNDG